MTAATTLEQVLTANRDRNWFFVSPGGNWGDDLIYAGADALAGKLDLRPRNFDFRSFDATHVPSGAAIYLHGGGGFNPWSSGRAFNILRQALAVEGAVVIQGPHTCSTLDEATAATLKTTFDDIRATEVHYFAREAETARFLRSALPGHIPVNVDHDTAFNLTQTRLLELAGLSRGVTGRYRLVVSREDNEAPPAAPSATHGAVIMDPARYATSFRHWLRIHYYATSITSDRLHSAILGSLIGKPVTLLAGAYHKNRSVWEFSLRERGVQWGDATTARGPETARRSLLPAFIARSWKVRRALMRLRGVPLQ